MQTKKKRISKEQKKKKGLSHALYAQLYSGKYTNKGLSKILYEMRNQLSFKELDEIVYSPYAKIHRIHDVIWGECYPKSVDKIGGKEHYFYKAENFRKEICWLSILVKHESEKLSSYVIKRDEIEKLILLGKFEQAECLLESVREELGYSVWYYEMRFLILSKQGKENEIWRLETVINEKTNQTSFFAYLIYSLAKRSMKSLSAYNYDAELDSQIERSRTTFHKDQCDFFHLFLNFYRNYSIKDLTAAICMVSPLAMIDRYNFFINILRASYVVRINDRRYIARLANSTYNCTHDKYLLALAYFEKKENLPSSYYDYDLIEILNEYYIGNFNMVLQLCRKYIKENPTNFDVVKIYVRALIFKNDQYYPIVKGENVLINEIAQQVYSVLTSKENANELTEFYQLQKSIYGLSIACGMDYFYKEEKYIQPDITLYSLSIWNYNPIFTRVLTSQEDRLVYINEGKAIFGDTPFLSLCEHRELLELINNDSIYVNIKEAQNAAIVYQKGDYQNAINLWNRVLETNEKYMPIAESAVQCIFDSYVKLNKNMEAIKFYVDKYLKGSAYVSKIDVISFMKFLRNNHYQCGIKHSVDFLIFIFKNADRDEQKGFILEKYWNYIGAKNVNEFIDKMNENGISQVKIEKVLSQLVVDDILRHSIFVNSTKKQLEDCQIICNYLCNLDSERHDLYIQWGTEIAYEIQVYENMNKMDESRIYANTNAIYKYVLAEKEDLYLQFKHLYRLSGQEEYTLFDGTAYITLNLAKQGERGYKRTSLAYNEIACQLFDTIKSAFLTSNFGLKTYLSTRIRHGVLEGEIRQCFDEQHLLLETNGNQYITDKWWKNRYGLREIEHAQLMGQLELLSKKTAKSIENFKSEVLQIKLQESDPGMFVYTIDRDSKVASIIKADENSNSYEEFCYRVMEILFQYTSTSLDQIRCYIRNEFSKILDDTLLDFEKELDMYQQIPKFYSEIKSSVQHVRDALNATMPRVESWFQLQEAHFEDFFLDENITVVWNIIERSYSNVVFEVEYKVSTELHQKIASTYCMPFGDVLSIIFTNMFQHSRKERPRKFVIYGYLEDGYAHLHFENKTTIEDDALNKCFRNIIGDTSRLQKEGGSGISKVEQILHYDLRCKDNRIEMYAKDRVCHTDVFINLNPIKV